MSGSGGGEEGAVVVGRCRGDGGVTDAGRQPIGRGGGRNKGKEKGKGKGGRRLGDRRRFREMQHVSEGGYRVPNPAGSDREVAGGHQGWEEVLEGAHWHLLQEVRFHQAEDLSPPRHDGVSGEVEQNEGEGGAFRQFGREEAADGHGDRPSAKEEVKGEVGGRDVGGGVPGSGGGRPGED